MPAGIPAIYRILAISLHSVSRFSAALLACALAPCGGGGGSSEIGTGVDLIEFGPTASYSFDETAGVIALNTEFNELHGEIVGATRVAGKIGNALDFSTVDGSRVLFDICCYGHPDTGEGDIWVSFATHTLTIAAWLKPTGMISDTIYPVFGGWYGSVQSMKLRTNNGTVEFLLYPDNNGNSVTLIISSSVLCNEEWTHASITYDGTQAVMYINGQEDNFSDIVMPVQDVVNDYFVSGIPKSHSAGSGRHFFPGTIDEFLLSGVKFSREEIAGLYAQAGQMLK